MNHYNSDYKAGSTAKIVAPGQDATLAAESTNKPWQNHVQGLNSSECSDAAQMSVERVPCFFCRTSSESGGSLESDESYQGFWLSLGLSLPVPAQAL